MKRFIPILLVLILLCFAACAKEAEIHTIDTHYRGRSLTVLLDTEAQTFSFDGHTCRYDFSDDGDHTEFRVAYPDGSTYWCSQNEHGGPSGWSNDYDPERYVDGDFLWRLFESYGLDDPGPAAGKAAAGVVMILLGGIHIALPHQMWYLSYGWRYKNAEPSDAAITIARISGLVAVGAGIVILLF